MDDRNGGPNPGSSSLSKSPPDLGGGGSKRKRVSLACNACRLRKSKCDGVRPKCSMCTDLDFHCEYQQSASSANTIVAKDYLGRLETRLMAVESLLAAQVGMTQGCATSSEAGRDSVSPDRSRRSDESRMKRKRDISPMPTADMSQGETCVKLGGGQLDDDGGAPDTVLDGMGALALGDEEDYGYFGPSSNIAFIGHVTKALANSASVTGAFPKDLRRTEASLEDPSRPLSPSHPPAAVDESEIDIRTGPVNMYILPCQKKARHYIDLYFQNTNILFPYLHQPSSLEAYETAHRDGFTKVRRTWLALLNLVMAMGSRSSTEKDVSTEEQYKTAEIFYQRGRLLCSGHFLQLASLDSVHLLLLMSHYLQSTRKPVQCWTTHGLAVRVAIQMGLHSNQALQRFTPLERELRKRAWYGCVLLDRTLCMTFGRPSAIAAYADTLSLPLDLDDASLSLTMATPPSVLPTPTTSCTPTTFFILSIKLYTLLGRIIDTLYGGNLGTDPTTPSQTFTDISRVAEIEEALSTWRSTLPTPLSIITASDIPPGGGPPSQFWRQSIILSLRYYNTRSLLHRQFAVKGLSEIWGAGPSSATAFEGDFFWNFGLASIRCCADSALETVRIVHRVRQRSDLLGFWWFTLYYTFNASLVLVSKILIASQSRRGASGGGGEEGVALVSGLEMAMGTLDVLAKNNRIANRCRLFLGNLLRYVTPLASLPQTGDTFLQPVDQSQSPFRSTTQLGDFMLESDFTYLHNMLPPLGMDDTGYGIGMMGGFGG